ncbi:insecticidal toxin complex [Fusarium tjaetaba]|uniref:Insecticidal toxin complex n=1 Tax=Fusarium tjaetaba TaxID=1567544 RepID=A0A8H5QD50_9HYPO|nr:insecticidal toxin complex [Fusarium tjaetaba]KAF5613092.1 insecticidal toxin complex [Fusarium tjaetaba]
MAWPIVNHRDVMLPMANTAAGRGPDLTSAMAKSKPPTMPSGFNPDPTTGRTDRQSSVIPSTEQFSRGGGGFKPISEKLDINPVNGTMSLALPIPIDQGRSNFGPTLNLLYDSGTGNGPFGFGWSLSGEAITRQASRCVPKYNADDVFVLSGQDDLVAAQEAAAVRLDKTSGQQFSVQLYRQRIETESNKIEKWTCRDDESNTHWRVISGDNVTAVYGQDSASRIFESSNGVVHIFSWLISSRYDSKGNAIEYIYKDEDTAGEQSETSGNNKYLKRVRYGNTQPNRDLDDWGLVVTPSEWVFEVVFDYGEHSIDSGRLEEVATWPLRKDPFSRFTSGFQIRTRRLCRSIVVLHHFQDKTGEQDTIVSSITLDYHESEQGSLLTAFTHHGFMVTGNNQSVRQSMPPFQFDYTVGPSPSSLQLVSCTPLDLQNVPTAGSWSSEARWVDLYCEGCPGLLYQDQGGGWMYQRNESAIQSSEDLQGGNLRFSAPVLLGAQPNLHGSSQTFFFQDLNSSGELQIVTRDENGRMMGFYERKDGSGWLNFQPFQAVANISDGLDNFMSADLTGNGLSDLFRVDELTQDVVWFPSLGKKGFGPPQSTRSESISPIWRRNDPGDEASTYLADMTGDGLADIVLISNGAVSYWPNMGYGRFGKEVLMKNAPFFESRDLFNRSRLHLLDADGCGTTDLVYLPADGGAMIYYNLAGNGWSHGALLAAFPNTDYRSSVFASDIVGNGCTCLCVADSVSGVTEMKYVDLAGGNKPYLLKGYSNGFGSVTTVTYQSSFKYYLDDERSGQPWSTKLPFPVHCVKQLGVVDEIAQTKTTKTYAYRDGKLFKKPQVHERFWFFTGSVDFETGFSASAPGELSLTPYLLPDLDSEQCHEVYRALKGLEYRQETYMEGLKSSSTAITATEQAYEVLPIIAAREGRSGVSRVVPRETLTRHYAVGSPSDTKIEHNLVLSVNTFGQATQTATVYYGRKAEHVDRESELDDKQKEIQKRTIIVLQETDYTNAIVDPGLFRKPAVCATRQYRLLGLQVAKDTLLRFNDLASFDHDMFPVLQDSPLTGMLLEMEATGHNARVLLGESRILYSSDDPLVCLEQGKLELCSIEYQQYDLAHTASMAAGVCAHVGVEKPSDVQTAAGYTKLDSDGSWWARRSAARVHPRGTKDSSLKSARASFYVPNTVVDPFGNESTTVFDEYFLLPNNVTDSMGSVTSFINGYRHLRPVETQDHNLNHQRVRLGAFGEELCHAQMGKMGQDVGDSLEGFLDVVSDNDIAALKTMSGAETARALLGKAGSRTIYDVNQYVREKASSDRVSPASIIRIVRQDTFRKGPSEKIAVQIQYLSGARKPISEFEAADYGGPSLNWKASRRTLDGDGNIMRSYHDEFTNSPDFKPASELDTTFTISFYDALGRKVASLDPDHCWTKAQFHPWRTVSFDAGDTVGFGQPSEDPDVGIFFSHLEPSLHKGSWLKTNSASEAKEKIDAAHKSMVYHNTPNTLYVDPLGHKIVSTTRNGDTIVSESFFYDLNGNCVESWDPMKRLAARNSYDLLGGSVYKGSMDAGETWSLLDCQGQVLYSSNSRELRTRTVFDQLRRKVQIWVRQGQGSETLVTKFEYGDAGKDGQKLNLRRQLVSVRDQAGLHTFDEYDIYGNVVLYTRRLAKAYKTDLDWAKPDEILLLPPEVSSSIFNAIGAPVATTDFAGNQSLMVYNAAGRIESLAWKSQASGVQSIYLKSATYSAFLEPTKLEYSNGTMTMYEYDALTQRLIRQKSTRRGKKGQQLLQDLSFTHDCVGRIIRTEDRCQHITYYSNLVIEPVAEYEYDWLGQLVQTRSREQISPGGFNPYSNEPKQKCGMEENNPASMTEYVERYKYDLCGNMSEMKHEGVDKQVVRTWTKSFVYDEKKAPSCLDVKANSNRLTSTIVDGRETHCGYDGEAGRVGCITSMSGYYDMTWDFDGRLRSSSRQKGGNEVTWNIYDYTGTRVRKVTEKLKGQSMMILKDTVYSENVEVYTYNGGVSGTSVRTTGVVHAEGLEIALVESTDNAPATPLVRFQTGRNIETDDNGERVSYEEYSAFGSTTLMACGAEIEAPRRYRFASYERDVETGLSYCNARFYAPWLCRWISTDPLGPVDGPNLYRYCRNDPINLDDPGGTFPNQDVVPDSGLRGPPRPPDNRRGRLDSSELPDVPDEGEGENQVPRNGGDGEVESIISLSEILHLVDPEEVDANQAGSNIQPDLDASAFRVPEPLDSSIDLNEVEVEQEKSDLASQEARWWQEKVGYRLEEAVHEFVQGLNPKPIPQPKPTEKKYTFLQKVWHTFSPCAGVPAGERTYRASTYNANGWKPKSVFSRGLGETRSKRR